MSSSKPKEPKEKTQTGVGFGTSKAGESTVITTIQNTTITRLPGRIVPVIQVSSGAEQGRILSLVQYQTITVGRAKTCELHVFDPGCSRQHAEFRMTPETGEAFIRDLGSSNGSKLNGKKLGPDAVKLNDGDRIQLGESTILRFSLMPEDDAQVQMKFYYQATRDALTSAFNSHQFDEALDREISYQKRAGHGLAIVLFDVDHFKRVNDSMGHPAGDEVLREIGNRVPACIRVEDIFARLGGEEFGVLARSENLEGVTILAERIRQAMEKKVVNFEGKQIWFTVSLGVAYLQGAKEGLSSAQFFQTADEALYEAKNAGRNRVVIKVLKT
jgi:diguanylate cyclase (GGDEF)-like protein